MAMTTPRQTIARGHEVTSTAGHRPLDVLDAFGPRVSSFAGNACLSLSGCWAWLADVASWGPDSLFARVVGIGPPPGRYARNRCWQSAFGHRTAAPSWPLLTWSGR